MKPMKLALSISTLALTVAGCGGGGGGGRVRGGAATTVLVPNVSFQVYAGTCAAVGNGPYILPDGASTDFTVTDIDNTDYMDVGVIDTAYGCNFNQAWGAVLDANSVTSGADNLPYGYYDFFVNCTNAFQPCQFRLNWTATY